MSPFLKREHEKSQKSGAISKYKTLCMWDRGCRGRQGSAYSLSKSLLGSIHMLIISSSFFSLRLHFGWAIKLIRSFLHCPFLIHPRWLADLPLWSYSLLAACLCQPHTERSIDCETLSLLPHPGVGKWEWLPANWLARTDMSRLVTVTGKHK